MSIIGSKSTERNSLRTVRQRTSTATETVFAISVSRRLNGCRAARRSCREVGVAEGPSGGKGWVPQRSCIRLWEPKRDRSLATRKNRFICRSSTFSKKLKVMKIRENDRKPSTLHNPRVREVGKGDRGGGGGGRRGRGEWGPRTPGFEKKVRELWAWP